MPDNKDHDTLIEVVQILKNHVANFDSHTVADSVAFAEIKKANSDTQKVIWSAAACVVTIGALPQVTNIIHLLFK